MLGFLEDKFRIQYIQQKSIWNKTIFATKKQEYKEVSLVLIDF